MSAVLDLLNEVRAAGIELEAAGDKLKVRAPSPPPASLLDRLRSYKSELLRMLADGTIADGEHSLPEHLADLATRVCLWRIDRPGQPARYVVAGPDHDLRLSESSAVPLFNEVRRDLVRRLPDVDVKDSWLTPRPVVRALRASARARHGVRR